MRKLILLMMAGLTAVSTNAQQSTSIVLTQARANSVTRAASAKAQSLTTKVHHTTANRTTNGSDGAWFSFQDAKNNGTSATNGFVINYPDSTLLVTTGTPPFNWWCHGVGTALDPTSEYFQDLWSNPNILAPDFAVTSSDAYTVDSVEIIGVEQRHFTTDVDTLYIEIAPAAQEALFTFTSGDSINVPEPNYTAATNDIMTTPGVVRITKLLDVASAGDTTAGGLNDWFIAIPGGVSVPAGSHLVAFTHFAPQQSSPLNTDIDSANAWIQLDWDLGISPLQAPGDFNIGLVAASEQRYATDPLTIDGGATFILEPSYAFTSPATIHDPYYNFHLVCPTCNEVGVKNVNNAINSVKAYPNPAVGEFYVPFTLNANANVTVTLTNAIGQVVSVQNMGNVKEGKATFNVATLADGLYIYTVQANGQRFTGRTVVAH